MTNLPQAADPATPAPVRGHVLVRTRAVERVLTALAARTLGVAARTVDVRVADERGSLRVDVRAPFGAADTTILAISDRVRDVVRDEGNDLTGARIGAVHVRITDIAPTTRRRVQ